MNYTYLKFSHGNIFMRLCIPLDRPMIFELLSKKFSNPELFSEKTVVSRI